MNDNYKEIEETNSLSEKKFYIFKKVSFMEKSNFFEFLSVMLDSGVNFIQALDSFKERAKNEFFKEKIEELKIYISSWESLSKSMKKIPDVFSDTETSIIESWEKSGSMVDSLQALSADYRKIHNLREKIKWALTYPIIIFIFLIVAVIVVMTYVIPMLKPLFDTAEVELPIATLALIWTSDFISNYIFLIITAFIWWILFLSFYKNTESGKQFFDRFLLNMPLIWSVYKNYILSRVARNLWVLMTSWVSILKTLSLVWKSTNNVVYNDLFDSIMNKVSSWNKIVDSMIEVDSTHSYFPSDFLQMLSVWEKTASMWRITEKINAQYTIEVDNSLANLTKWIEPIAIAWAWIFVLWFAFAIFWAILKLTQTVW